MQRKYYEAYDDRYCQVHKEKLQWFQKEPSAIVIETAEEFSLLPAHKILEIGCGEGRDAIFLLQKGYDVLATDVSAEAIRYCAEQFPAFSERFQVLDCLGEELAESFDFIYAVAVVHMLVPDEDRNGFYQFIRKHLKGDGIALICTMGDGNIERQSDISNAFDIQERVHEQTGKRMQIASTSCRMVGLQTFSKELVRNGLSVLRQGITCVEPDFPQMMYAVVRKADQ